MTLKENLIKINLLFCSLLILMVSLFSVLAGGAKATPKTAELLIKFKSGISSKKINSILKRQDAEIAGRLSRLNVLTLSVRESARGQIISSLAGHSAVDYVEPNYQAKAFFTPNDTYFSSRQWGLENTAQNIKGVVGKADADIDAAAAWNYTRGTSTSGPVKIAILDTGIDGDHADLTGKVVASQNFSDSPSTDDLNGHGTHVAGIAAANTNNAAGVAGGCPDCQLMNIKVLDDDGSGYYDSIAEGIVWAADNGAKVINLSLGSWWPSSTLAKAIYHARTKGALTVAAAGNCGCGSKSYPAAYSKAIAVAASNSKDKRASFTSYGKSWVDVAAPGENIFSTLPEGEYGYLSGTSMSTPLVSATAALIWSTPYGSSATNVRNRLESKAQKISGTGTYWSKGRINVRTAVTH